MEMVELTQAGAELGLGFVVTIVVFSARLASGSSVPSA